MPLGKFNNGRRLFLSGVGTALDSGCKREQIKAMNKLVGWHGRSPVLLWAFPKSESCLGTEVCLTSTVSYHLAMGRQGGQTRACGAYKFEKGPTNLGGEFLQTQVLVGEFISASSMGFRSYDCLQPRLHHRGWCYLTGDDHISKESWSLTVLLGVRSGPEDRQRTNKKQY